MPKRLPIDLPKDFVDHLQAHTAKIAPASGKMRTLLGGSSAWLLFFGKKWEEMKDRDVYFICDDPAWNPGENGVSVYNELKSNGQISFAQKGDCIQFEEKGIDYNFRKNDFRFFSNFQIGITIENSEVYFDPEHPERHEIDFEKFLNEKTIITYDLNQLVDSAQKNQNSVEENDDIKALAFVLKSYLNPLLIPGMHFDRETAKALLSMRDNVNLGKLKERLMGKSYLMTEHGLKFIYLVAELSEAQYKIKDLEEALQQGSTNYNLVQETLAQEKKKNQGKNDKAHQYRAELTHHKMALQERHIHVGMLQETVENLKKRIELEKATYHETIKKLKSEHESKMKMVEKTMENERDGYLESWVDKSKRISTLEQENTSLKRELLKSREAGKESSAEILRLKKEIELLKQDKSTIKKEKMPAVDSIKKKMLDCVNGFVMQQEKSINEHVFDLMLELEEIYNQFKKDAREIERFDYIRQFLSESNIVTKSTAKNELIGRLQRCIDINLAPSNDISDIMLFQMHGASLWMEQFQLNSNTNKSSEGIRQYFTQLKQSYPNMPTDFLFTQYFISIRKFLEFQRKPYFPSKNPWVTCFLPSIKLDCNVDEYIVAAIDHLRKNDIFPFSSSQKNNVDYLRATLIAIVIKLRRDILDPNDSLSMSLRLVEQRLKNDAYTTSALLHAKNVEKPNTNNDPEPEDEPSVYCTIL